MAKLVQVNRFHQTLFILIIIRSSCRNQSKVRKRSCYRHSQTSHIHRIFPGLTMGGCWTAIRKFQKWRLISTSLNIIIKIQIQVLIKTYLKMTLVCNRLGLFKVTTNYCKMLNCRVWWPCKTKVVKKEQTEPLSPTHDGCEYHWC